MYCFLNLFSILFIFIRGEKQSIKSPRFSFWGTSSGFKEDFYFQDLSPLVIPLSPEAVIDRRSYEIGPSRRVHFYNHAREPKYRDYDKIHQYEPNIRDYTIRGYDSYHEYSHVHAYEDPWEYFDYIDYRPHLKRHRSKSKKVQYVKVKSKDK